MKHKRFLASVLSAVLIWNTFSTSIVTYAMDPSLTNEKEVTNPQETEMQDKTLEDTDGESDSEEKVEEPVKEADKEENPSEKEDTPSEKPIKAPGDVETPGEEQAETSPESTEPKKEDTTKEPESKETEEEEAVFDLEASVAELKKMIQSGKGGFSEVVGFLRDSGHFYEVYTGISEKTQKIFLKGLNKNQLYQFEQYAKYAFVDTMRAYEEKENLTKTDVEALASYADVYGDLVKRSQKVGSIKPEKVVVLDKEVFDTILSSLNEKIVKEKEISDFQSYGEYLQEISSFDVSEVLDGFNNFSCIHPEKLPREVKEFKNFIYATYGFDELIEKAEDEKSNEKKAKTGKERNSKAVNAVDTSNLFTINMHDYDDSMIEDKRPNPKELLNYPINKNREFVFQYWLDDTYMSPDWNGGGTRWWNNYHADPNTVDTNKKYQKGIVAPNLVNGYPVLSNEAKPGYSLDYLFSGQPSAGIKATYKNLNYLFEQDENGTYHVSSLNDKIELQPNGNFSHKPYTSEDEKAFDPLLSISGQSKRNRWIGMDISSEFTIPKNGQINGKDMTFSFTGDDDLWVFIDDVLVLDLGGIHNMVSGSINFRTGNVEEGYIYSTKAQNADPENQVRGSISHTIVSSFQKAGKTWNGVAGSKHTIKIFYLERGFGDANFNLSIDAPILYDVVYHGNGATSGSTATSNHIYGVVQNLTPNGFKRTDYTFTGWNTKPDGSGTSYSDQQAVKNLTKVNGGIVDLYAQWTPAKYTNEIWHRMHGVTGEDGQDMLLGITEFSAIYNSTYKMDASRATKIPNGYTLSNTFRYKNNGTYKDYTLGKTMTQEAKTMSYVYMYDPIDYKITYELDGGKNDSENPSKYNILNGITLKDPTRKGFLFGGWYLGDKKVTGINEGKGATFSSVDAMYTDLANRTTGDLTLTAKWTPITYTITYDKNGATSGYTYDSYHTYDVEKALTTNGYTKKGYIFKGWNTEADGSGTSYSDKQVVKNLTATQGAIVTLYAQWEEVEIVVVYDGNENDSGMPQMEVVKSSDVLKNGYVIEKNEGFTSYGKKYHTFIGWNPDRRTPSYKAAYKEEKPENRISYDELETIYKSQARERKNKVSLSAKESKALGVSENTPVATLYALWDKAPELEATNVLEFYEGEDIKKGDLLNIVSYDQEDSQQNIKLEDVRITKIEYADGKLVDGKKQKGRVDVPEKGKNDLPDDYKLDTWGFQMDKKDSPVTHKITFEVTDSVGNTTVLEWKVKVKYNEFPEIKTEERYFTLEEANSGVITKEELLDRVRAWDLEDCKERPLKEHAVCNHPERETCLDDPEKCAFAQKVDLVGFDAEEFKTLTESAYIAVPCRVEDQFGKETMVQIGVYVSKDGETPEGPDVRYVRFIDEKNYDKGISTSNKGRVAEVENRGDGSLHAESKWYTDDAYKAILSETFDKTGATPLTFKGDELKEIQQKGESSGSPSIFYEKYVKDKMEQ